MNQLNCVWLANPAAEVLAGQLVQIFPHLNIFQNSLGENITFVDFQLESVAPTYAYCPT